MDASSRRGTYGRIPGLAALTLLVLVALSVVVISTSVDGPSTVSNIYRRETDRLVWRQEGGDGAEDPVEVPSPRPNATRVFETGSSSTGTQTSSTIESLITTTTATRNTTSTVTRSATPISTTTETRTSTTSTSSSSNSTTSSVSSTTTTSTSTSSIPSTASSKPTPSSSTPARSLRTSATTPVAPVTTLSIEADGFFSQTSAATSSTQPGNGFDPTPTANAGDAVGAAQKGFLQNKGAVAGVCVVVALIGIGLLALLFVYFARRGVGSRQRRLHAQLFGGKYSRSEASHAQSHERLASGGSDYGSGSEKGLAPGLKSKASKASLKEKGIVYDDSRFRGATVTSEYPFGSAQGLGQFPSSSPSAPLQHPAQQQITTSVPPPQNPFEDASNYHYNSAGTHSFESHYTQEDPFQTPPPSASPYATAGLRPMVPALTVTSPHNTQYLARVPSGSTIFSQQGVAAQVQHDGASTYSQQSYDGLAYDYGDSAPETSGGALPAGARGSYGQASIDSFYGAPASAGVKGPTITVKY